MGACVIQVSTRDQAEAERIAASLVEHRLAAAVNIVGAMTSFFRWEGEVRKRPEVLLLAKTRETLVDSAIEHILEHHGYQCPSILALPATAGHRAYLNWIDAETRAGGLATG